MGVQRAVGVFDGLPNCAALVGIAGRHARHYSAICVCLEACIVGLVYFKLSIVWHDPLFTTHHANPKPQAR